jgi:hypothetical protein
VRNHGQELWWTLVQRLPGPPNSDAFNVPCGFRFLSIIGLTNSFADVAALVAERVWIDFTPVLASRQKTCQLKNAAWVRGREVGELSLA